jgi:hypothetical protein
MSRLLDRVSFESGTVGPGAAVEDVIGRLERGESWEAVASALDLKPADILAALAADALGDAGALGPPLVQASPRRPKLLAALSEPALPNAAGPGRGARLALAAGLLQIHEFWDASHAAAQEADDLGERYHSAYWHAIAHRREPDFGNAAYWLRRVGRHPIFDDLGHDARALAESLPSDVSAELAGLFPVWNPSRLVELCSGARPGTSRDAAAGGAQRLEMLRLLEATAEGIW